VVTLRKGLGNLSTYAGASAPIDWSASRAEQDAKRDALTASTRSAFRDRIKALTVALTAAAAFPPLTIVAGAMLGAVGICVVLGEAFISLGKALKLGKDPNSPEEIERAGKAVARLLARGMVPPPFNNGIEWTATQYANTLEQCEALAFGAPEGIGEHIAAFAGALRREEVWRDEDVIAAATALGTVSPIFGAPPVVYAPPAQVAELVARVLVAFNRAVGFDTPFASVRAAALAAAEKARAELPNKPGAPAWVKANIGTSAAGSLWVAAEAYRAGAEVARKESVKLPPSLATLAQAMAPLVDGTIAAEAPAPVVTEGAQLAARNASSESGAGTVLVVGGLAAAAAGLAWWKFGRKKRRR
jgi:hypothetical protein